MSPHPHCPRCGRPNVNTNLFCASCGASLSSQVKKNSGGSGVKLLLGAVAVFAGLLWAAAIYTQQGRPLTPPQQAAKSTLLGSDAPAAPHASQLQSQDLTSAQHLSEAKRALAEGYKPNKDPKKASWGEIAAAKWHLKAITQGAAEYRDAQELLKEVARRERQIQLAARPSTTLTTEEVAHAAVEAAVAEEEKTQAAAPTPPAGRARTSSSTSTPSGPAETEGRLNAPSTGGYGSTSSRDYYTNSRGRRVQRPTFSEGGPPAGASAQCRDGSYSFSMSRRGTCSHHGGVARWL